MWKSVLRIRIRDPAPFWSLDPGWVKSGSVSGIRIRDQAPFWSLDPGWGKVRIRIRDEQPGSSFLELRNNFFGLKYLNSFMQIRDGKNSDPGRKKIGSGSGIGKNFLDPQHWRKLYSVLASWLYCSGFDSRVQSCVSDPTMISIRVRIHLFLPWWDFVPNEPK